MQHFGPVLRFGAACAGVDGDDGRERGVFARKQHLGFEFGQELAVAFHFAHDVGGNGFAFAGEIEKGVEIVGEAGDLRVGVNRLFEAFAILHDLLAAFGLGPEIGRGDLVGQSFYLFGLFGCVKDNSGRQMPVHVAERIRVRVLRAS